MLGAVFKDVSDDAHALTGRIDVRSASNVFLKQVILNRSADSRRRHTLFFSDQFVHQQQNRTG